MEEIEAGLWATLRADVRDSIQLLGAACQQKVCMQKETAHLIIFPIRERENGLMTRFQILRPSMDELQPYSYRHC
jgi:hypothetical protein